MNHLEDYPFHYNDGRLCLGSIPLDQMLLQCSTPLYCYSLEKVESQALNFVRTAQQAGLIELLACYALKANPHPEILQRLAQLGLGADVVSGGELNRALECGIPAERIVFSGVGKTPDELKLALEAQICSINVESLDELDELNRLSQGVKKQVNVALRLNPRVRPQTHRGISTGEAGHKFGLSKQEIISVLKSWDQYSNLRLVGLSIHIGSQLTDMQATLEATQNLIDLARQCPQQLDFLDVGGGLGLNYHPQDKKLIQVQQYMTELAQLLIPAQKELHIKRIIFEPGRYIVARAGVLLSRVLRVKDVEGRRFVILDTGMNHLMRPALYESYHHMIPLREPSCEAPLLPQSVVGPICETTDTFTLDREMPELQKGEIVAILDAGAYGASMSNNYNLRGSVAEKCL